MRHMDGGQGCHQGEPSGEVGDRDQTSHFLTGVVDTQRSSLSSVLDYTLRLTSFPSFCCFSSKNRFDKR